MFRKNSKLELSVIDMHTGGEPLRILHDFALPICGSTILEKRRFFRDHYDHIRKFLMFEPRGHADMYGAVIVDSNHAHFGTLFLHNEGYSTFCGHAVIALARWAVESGKVERSAREETAMKIECPAGVVDAYYSNVTGNVRFKSMPAFSFMNDLSCSVQLSSTTGPKNINVDIGYGGTFYAVVEASTVDIDLNDLNVPKLKLTASAIKESLKTIPLKHPLHEDVQFLYGVIFVDSAKPTLESKNVCVFADGQVDRSPTGSGVTARMALLFERKRVSINQEIKFICPVGNSMFTGKVINAVDFHGSKAVQVEVAGKAYFTGSCKFIAEEDDPTYPGFHVQS